MVLASYFTLRLSWLQCYTFHLTGHGVTIVHIFRMSQFRLISNDFFETSYLRMYNPTESVNPIHDGFNSLNNKSLHVMQKFCKPSTIP